MFKTWTPSLNVAAIIVVVAVAIALYFQTTTAPAPAPAVVEEEAVPQIQVAPPVTGPAAVGFSGYVSEEDLKWSLDQAAEHHWSSLADTLLRKINGRYERRVNRLPW